MGVDNGGEVGEQVSPEFGARGLSLQILSCCKILSTRSLALQCRKMCFCRLYSRTFIVSPARRPPEFQSDLRPWTQLLYLACVPVLVLSCVAACWSCVSKYVCHLFNNKELLYFTFSVASYRSPSQNCAIGRHSAPVCRTKQLWCTSHTAWRLG